MEALKWYKLKNKKNTEESAGFFFLFFRRLVVTWLLVYKNDECDKLENSKINERKI